MEFAGPLTLEASAETFISEEKTQENSTAAWVSFSASDLVPMDTNQQSEILFLVDQSGSMRGNPIEQTKQALNYFMHSLTTNCSFNIIGFGTTFEKLFSESKKYCDETLEEAKEYIQRIDARLGGTNMLSPLQEIFKMCEGKKNVQLIILTDGGVSDTEIVIALVHENRAKLRVFSIGIGSSVSTSLVEGLANAGRGSYEFLSEQNLHALQKITLRQLQRALRVPCEVDVKWLQGGAVVEKTETLVSPSGRSSSAFTAFGYWKNLKGTEELEAEISVVTDSASNKVKIPLKVRTISTSNDKILHPVAARSIIRHLEFSKENKEKVIELSKRNSILSKHTAFVAVDNLGNKKAVSGTMIQVQPQRPITSAQTTRKRKVEYKDENGAVLSPKEAFRIMSHQFHGKKTHQATPEVMEELSLEASKERQKITNQPKFIQKYYHKGVFMETDPQEKEPDNTALRHSIVNKQKADGSWTKEVLELLGLDASSGNTMKAQEILGKVAPSSPRQNAWFTCLAVVWLELQKDCKDETMLIVQKGKQWMKTHLTEDLINKITELANEEVQHRA